MDGLWTEVCGRQTQSNDPGNNQHILGGGGGGYAVGHHVTLCES